MALGRRLRIAGLYGLGWLMLALALFGHATLLIVGAVDALISAAVGTRPLGRLARQLADVVNTTWREGR